MIILVSLPEHWLLQLLICTMAWVFMQLRKWRKSLWQFKGRNMTISASSVQG